MTITPHIFEAYLKCPMKCWLRAVGEPSSRNSYAEWVHNQAESYRVEEAKRLLTQTPTEEYAILPCSSRRDGVDTSAEGLKTAKWRLALDVFLRADENQTPNGFHRGVHYSVSLPEFRQRELGAAKPPFASHYLS